ncbi:MAG: hypothetical protein QOG03_393 [Actinomycetota bacterium]|nr:hypothetical protein [Actinomycetota bacterium]
MILAHAGRCSGPETASTVALATVLSIVLFRPWRKTVARAANRLTRVVLPIVVVAAVTLTGCGGSKKASTTTASPPPTTARIRIDSPTPGQVLGPDVTVKVTIIGGTAVQRVNGPLTATEGHVHVVLDGSLVAMAYGTTQDLHNVKPGIHLLKAVFVAVNHQPFPNSPQASVGFTVK